MVSGESRKTVLYNFIIPACLLLAPLVSAYGYIPFIGMCLHIVFDLSYQGFLRQSRFGVSQNHPWLNRFLNILVLILPFTAFLFRGGAAVFIPLILILHIISEYRSPDEENGFKPLMSRPAAKYIAWLTFYFIGLAALMWRG